MRCRNSPKGLIKLASIEDAPERYQSLARKVPSQVLANIGPRELRARVEAAGDKLEELAYAKDDYERQRLRKEADAILNSVSLRAFIVAAKSLTDGIADAKRRQAGREDYELTKQFDDLYRRNPQPGMTNPDVLAEISVTHAPKPRRWFQFWRKND